ncbi:DUF2777 family protein [Priestia filamentosa]|uniref:Uncharacterized protein n=1 Tax=Priestia filamentosa TaxID=1402861 RepID=A0A1X7FJ49_9BACI|nr:DUF2777 family protein [Priestia filamentosa]AKO91283.1 hypothetical protein BEH_03640 [Priestia filamentosa]MDT3765387.1 DUF2777 family protein [Priestia filamentosa]OXS67156.1 hypothetical protein B1B01_16815 [Priestia filamentosa]RJS65344.1 DUF2777 domain-containing protein [Priestia filamentosa]WCM16448.1 DUF2777 family protein [Priestia filamentosa]
MKNLSKTQCLEMQPRSFILGTLECIDSQWIFFDEEDEASMLQDILSSSCEVYWKGHWQKACWKKDNSFEINNTVCFLQDGAELRVGKKLQHAYQLLIDELSTHSFMRLSQLLNDLSFSLYDCIYCFNTLCFLPTDGERNGVNFLIFDNEERICSVHHHFDCSEGNDRFEITLNTGEQFLSSDLKKLG